MPEETAPATEQETPAPPESGPEEGTPAAPDDWQERYEEAQTLIGRQGQELGELRQYRELADRARQGDAEAIAALGFELADTEDDEVDDEEYQDPDERLERIEQALAQRQEQEQAQEQEAQWLDEAAAHVEKQVAALSKEHGELDQAEVEYLLNLGAAFPDENGFPDLAKAFETDSQRLEAKRQGWVKTKRTPQAPSGASPSSQPDLDDDEQRREYVAQRLAHRND